MGAFAKWLLHEDQKDLFEELYSSLVNLLFIGFAVLLSGSWVDWILRFG
jgi:hypothetical protein